VWTVKSWGKDAALIGARLPSSLCIGNACIDSLMIYFERSGLENLRFDKYKFPTNGLIGNAVFIYQYSMALDLAGQRLGLMNGSLCVRQSGSSRLPNLRRLQKVTLRYTVHCFN
jgi:hypothetical protein